MLFHCGVTSLRSKRFLRFFCTLIRSILGFGLEETGARENVRRGRERGRGQKCGIYGNVCFAGYKVTNTQLATIPTYTSGGERDNAKKTFLYITLKDKTRSSFTSPPPLFPPCLSIKSLIELPTR